MLEKLLELGIDPWKMVLYLANAGVLIAVLTYFFYRPMIQFIDKRRKQISDSISEAKNLRDAFEDQVAKSKQEKEAMELEFKNEMARLKKFTDQKRAEMIADMEAEKAKMMQKAQEEIDQKKAKLIGEAEEEIKSLMTRIILHIVENKVPEDVIQGSIKSAWKSYSK